METISRPYRFLLLSYYVVQSSYGVHPIFEGRSENVAGVTGVKLVLIHNAYPQRDGQAGLTWVAGYIPK